MQKPIILIKRQKRKFSKSGEVLTSTRKKKRGKKKKRSTKKQNSKHRRRSKKKNSVTAKQKVPNSRTRLYKCSDCSSYFKSEVRRDEHYNLAHTSGPHKKPRKKAYNGTSKKLKKKTLTQGSGIFSEFDYKRNGLAVQGGAPGLGKNK